MATFLWLLVVALGPVLLGVAYVYAFSRRRRLTPEERASQHQAVEAMYNDTSDETPSRASPRPAPEQTK